jgi:hypothetical protein
MLYIIIILFAIFHKKYLLIINMCSRCIGIDGTENCKGERLFRCSLLGCCSQKYLEEVSSCNIFVIKVKLALFGL